MTTTATASDLLAERQAGLADAGRRLAELDGVIDQARADVGIEDSRANRSALIRAQRARAEAAETVLNLERAVDRLVPAAEEERLGRIHGHIAELRPKATEITDAATAVNLRILAAVDAILEAEVELDGLELDAQRLNIEIRSQGARLGRPTALPAAIVRRSGVSWRLVRSDVARVAQGGQR